MSFKLHGAEVTLRPLSHDDAPALASAAAESREHYGYTNVPEGLDSLLYTQDNPATHGRILPYGAITTNKELS